MSIILLFLHLLLLMNHAFNLVSVFMVEVLSLIVHVRLSASLLVCYAMFANITQCTIINWIAYTIIFQENYLYLITFYGLYLSYIFFSIQLATIWLKILAWNLIWQLAKLTLGCQVLFLQHLILQTLGA